MSPRVLLLDGHELEGSRRALERFPNAISILDAGSLRAGIAELAGKVQYLIASEKFGRQSCRLESLNRKSARHTAVARLRQRYGNVVVITLGERGLIGDDGTGYFELPAFKAKAIDTTAAGDIFHGAFAYAMARKLEFKEALLLSSMAASLSVQRRGGRPSIPTLAEVKAALRRASSRPGAGVMTFIVNQQGRVYQKDLGPKTHKLARKMNTYDPDPSWTLSPD